MNAEKGGAAVLWGVQKIKGRKKKEGRAWAYGFLFWGRFDPRVLGRVRREYIRAGDPFFPHFTKSFSLFSPHHRFSLFSLLPHSSSPTRRSR